MSENANVEVLSNGIHRDHKWQLERHLDVRDGPMPLGELVVTVDGNVVTDASTLERNDWADGPNWAKALRNYAMGYINGMEA